MPSAEKIEAVRFQERACRNLDSLFYATILGDALRHADASHPFWQVLEAFDGDPVADLVALRLLGAIHDLVLAGKGDFDRAARRRGGGLEGRPAPERGAQCAARPGRPDLVGLRGQPEASTAAQPRQQGLHAAASGNALAFGIGNHFCLGANLSRMEIRLAVEALMERFPEMQFQPGHEPERMASLLFRGIKSMPFTLSGARA